MSENDNDTGFGEPKYGGGGSTYAKRVKLKPGHNVVRVIPPMKSLAESGDWMRYHAQHFGFYIPNPKDTDKPLLAPWECVEQKKGRDGIITQECEECENVKRQQHLLEARTDEANEKGMNEEQKKVFLAPLKDWLKNHNLDKKYYINVKTQDGEFGYMALPWKAYSALKERMDQVREEEGVDPIRTREGCWFDVVRSGEGFDTTYRCDAVYEVTVVDGKKMRSLKPGPLSKSDFDTAMRDCADLATEVTRKVTVEQAKLLSKSSGDPEDIQRILGLSKRRESSPERSPERSATRKPEPAKAEPKPAPKPVPAPVVEESPVVEDDEEAMLLKKLEEAKKRKAAAKAAAAAPKVEETQRKTLPADPTAMSDDDFLATFSDPSKK